MSTLLHGRARGTGGVSAVVRSAHPGPTVVVTAVAGVLAVVAGASGPRAALVVAAVLSGQLSIGWSNDLLDRERDTAVGRRDKPLATGGASPALVRRLCAAALVATLVLSLAWGPVAGLLHLVCVVGGGWAYNLRLKATAWSWLPYAVAFGALPVSVSLAARPDVPAAWVPLAGALLGVGAHLVNALPDLDDDAATGVRGLPQRLGARRAAAAATAVLVAASLLIALVAPGGPGAATAAALVVVAGLAAVALLGRGRWPFRAAMAIAVTDVLMLVLR